MNTNDINKLKVIKAKCDNDLLFFTRYFFKENKKQKFITNWHHKVICDELHKLENYKTLVLNINIPPRFSKTELAAVNFIARSLGLNPSANFLYITAGDELRTQTSIEIRNLVTSDSYKQLYDLELRKDQNAKNLWRTNKGGGLKTATIFGQIIGFGAGKMIDHNQDLIDYLRDFEGCIILDDINKMDDAENLTANNTKANRIIGNTILSRKNSKDTPIINIQQRAGMDDATAYLQDHFKDNDKLKTLILPVKDVITGKPLWNWKMGLEEINELEQSPKTKGTFLCQYMQDPQPDSESLFFTLKKDYFLVDSIPKNANKVPYGFDFGDSPDPCALVDIYELNGELWLNELIYETELSNIAPQDYETEKTVDFRLQEVGLTKKDWIIADNENKSIRELRMAGWEYILPAKKGPGSIMFGIKKMKSFKRINVTKRSINLIMELKGYKKLKDPVTGTYLPKPDPKCRAKHLIDAARYSISAHGHYWGID